MAGVQVAGLVSGINWQNIISEIITADSASMDQVKGQQTFVDSQNTTLGALGTDLNSLQDSLLSLEDPSLFSAVTANSTTSGSSWQISAAQGTPTGSYTLGVTALATASQLTGGSDISAPLNATSDVNGLTVANMKTATAVTAGTFTVNGQQVNVTTSESLQDVFTAISTATGGTVTAAYDPSADKVKLTSTSGNVILGADNDTSNLLSALKLSNNGTNIVSSSSTLGTAQLGQTLAAAGLKAAITGTDSSGNGSLQVNGVTINYNVNTDTLSTLLGRITNSGAGVNATYDSTNDRIVLTDSSTGNYGISANDVSGNLLSALGVTGSGAALTQGTNAQFTVNGGPVQTSTSNILTGSQLGAPGLQVTINTRDTQTIQVATDTSQMQNAIQTFITAFNQVQSDIASDTLVTTSASGAVTTSILSGNYEVGDWASTLEMTAFRAGSGVGGAISSLDALGIDFGGTSTQMSITDSATLEQALTNNPQAVANFFQTAKTGFGSMLNATISDIIGQNNSEQQTEESESTSLGNQITTMQNQLNSTQSTLETEFENMETLESKYQSELSAIDAIGTGSTSSDSSSTPTASTSSSSSSSSS